MSLSPAPFHQFPGTSEVPAEAYWLRSDDDVRLRVALWRANDAAGTILLFPGRTEYVEKYAPVGALLTAAGFNVLAIDWRGQGLADRLQENPRPGHIADFAQYQLDVVAMVEAAATLELTEPWHLLAHSMGGTIGLAALHNGLPVDTATFSAPMWGINHAPMPQAVALALAGVAGRLGRGGAAAFGTGGDGTYVMDEPFRNNLLTSDAESWARMVREAATWPDLTLGGATYSWVGNALGECRRLAAEPSPDVPMLVSLGSRELIVSGPAIRARAAAWPAGRLLELDGAHHEVMFETPELQEQFFAAFLGLLGVR
ncbi:alpha/beta fold hydrolase [Paracoccus xiamenensis]|uniref:alpha/beta fold hydrolase n=1 Tax=Paracoccus xiamenensis TaxID=2714901 RepID=UPI00140A1A28|nr:alpha/beta hydrolase [Paracoccus xiamenensis]NHF71693.1 alpha/beta hydrolase [Paracoccus xiamenensis]